MYHNHSSFWDNIFFPHRNDNNNTKRVVILSAITGVASAAIANFFAKKENRINTRHAFQRLSDDIRHIKDNLSDKAHDIADDASRNFKNKSRQIGDKIPDVDIKNDKSNWE
jgi:hypothetical protein